MRALRILGGMIGGFAAAVALLLTVLQSAPARHWVAATMSRLASSGEMRVELRELDGFIPTDLTIGELEVADRKGVWLRAEEVRLSWSIAPLFSGWLRIDNLTARQIDVRRLPYPSRTDEPSSGEFTGLPFAVDLRLASVPELNLHESVAGVRSSWKLDAAASLPADDGASHLHVTLDRTDGPAAHASADLRFRLAPLSIDGRIAVEESTRGGLVAELIGRPDLERTSLEMTAQGNAQSGNVVLTAGAGDAVTSEGRVHWERVGADTQVSLRLQAATSGLPDSPLARALAQPLELQGSARFDAARTWSVERLTLESGPTRIEGTGRYDMATDKLEASVDVMVPDAGPYSALAGGAGWRDLRATIRSELRDLARDPAGTAMVTAMVDDVRGMPSGRLEVAATIELRKGGNLIVQDGSLSEAGAVALFGGSYRPSTSVGEMTARLRIADLDRYSPLAGVTLGGAGELELSARVDKERVRLRWNGSFDALTLPGVPERITRPSVSTRGAVEFADGAWIVEALRVESPALSLQVDGRGHERNGDLRLSASVPRVEALQPEITGALEATADLSVSNETVAGELRVQGTLADRPARLDGRFRRGADGALSVPGAQGDWASAVVNVTDLEISPRGATGHGHLRISSLADFSVLVGVPMDGSIDLKVATEPNPGGAVMVVLRGEALRSGDRRVARLAFDGTVRDPFGAAETDAHLDADGIAGVDEVGRLEATARGDLHAVDVALRAGGTNLSADLAARVERTADEIRLAVSRFTGRYRGVPVGLAGALRATIRGERTTIDPASLRLGSGNVRIAGTVDPQTSNLEADISALPLALLSSLTPGVGIEGTLQARLRAHGPAANPRLQATYNATGLRWRRPGTALLPSLALRGSASLVERRATFDIRLGGGGSTNLTLRGDATLAPFDARVAIRGTVDIGPFSPLLGNSIRNVSGTLRPNLRLAITPDGIAGDGSAALAGVAFALPDSGLRLSGGEGTLALAGDVLRLQRLAFQTAGGGRVGAAGTVALDPERGFPLDLAIETQRALAVSRPDLVVAVTSDVKVTGSMVDGVDVGGNLRLDRTEIAIGAQQAAGYPTIPVREINLPAGESDAIAPGGDAAGLPVRLALEIAAPDAVFVRGRGLDAEMSGQLQVAGTASRPSVLGNLTLRRGTFNLAGRRLNFTRGNVSLLTADTLDPLLDFVATTSVQSTTIEVAIGGTSRAPTFSVSASPPLPQDEAMAMLLFGKPSAGLSPFEILSAAEAIGELSGRTSPAQGFLGRLRRSLGLDQLSVDGAGGQGPSLGAGRYLAPGVYVGARQGAGAGSSRGVVEIEVFPNTKVEADVGADVNSRLGVKMEWDY